MTRVLKDEERVARKAYPCDASAHWHNCNMGPDDCESEHDREVLAAAEADGFRILPGQTYRYVCAVDEFPFTWRERIDMGRLCTSYELYED
jgi:hypothetical protein